jgi:hypothetical protein
MATMTSPHRISPEALALADRLREIAAADPGTARRRPAKPRQTSRNNFFLAHVRGLMNQTIYKKAASLLNREGEDAARAYLGQFFKSGQYPG